MIDNGLQKKINEVIVIATVGSFDRVTVEEAILTLNGIERLSDGMTITFFLSSDITGGVKSYDYASINVNGTKYPLKTTSNENVDNSILIGGVCYSLTYGGSCFFIRGGGGAVVYELETITISQEWTVPNDIVGKVAIRLFGGGGSGGQNAGGGGGHMAYGEFDLKAGDKYAITIGIGGGLGVESYTTGSTLSKVTAYKVVGERAGAATSFGSLLSANGGGGGSENGGSGGTGGGSGSTGSAGTGSYGGAGGSGYNPGGNGIDTTGFNNPKLIKGTGLGGSQTDGDSGGGGGYGGTGGSGYSYYGGGGGGYGGTGGVGSAYGDAPTGYACGGGGIQAMGSFTGSTGKYISGWGTQGCVLISYLRKTAGDKERYAI